jgi:hypothetical protein
VDLDQRLSSHPTEEALEEFALDRLPDELVKELEEHLLICRQCQDSVSEIDRFVFTFRAYAHQKAAHRVPAASLWRDALAALPRLVMSKTNVAPVLVLAILVLAIVQPGPPTSPPSVAVTLTSMRGSTGALSVVPEGKPLELSIDAPDLNLEKGPFQVQIVDSTGNLIWTGRAAQTGGKVTAPLPKPLLRGIYWVRLYAGNSELLEEFGLAAN